MTQAAYHAEIDAERLTWGGVDVATWAVHAIDVSGLLAMPARRSENLIAAGRDGAIRRPRKPYGEREFEIEFLLRGCLPDGTIPASGPTRQFYQSIDTLSALCALDVAPLVHTLPGNGTEQRELPVEVLAAVEPRRWLAGESGLVKIVFSSHSAWWRGLAPVTSTLTLADGASGALGEFASSTGRIDDALVTFGVGTSTGNNPTLLQPSTGLALGYDATIGAAQRITLGDYSWTPVGLTFNRHALRTDARIGPWWVLDCGLPGVAPVVQLDLTGGGPMTISVAARPSWAVG